jgi:hypothetical protein
MPENTSLAGATSFNHKTVTYFHHNCRELLVNFKFPAQQIYNLKETEVMTAVQAPHIVAQTGVKQVGHVVPAEKAN